jgi:hypothetical protein
MIGEEHAAMRGRAAIDFEILTRGDGAVEADCKSAPIAQHLVEPRGGLGRRLSRCKSAAIVRWHLNGEDDPTLAVLRKAVVLR